MNERPRPSGRRRPLPSPAAAEVDGVEVRGVEARSFEDIERAARERQRSRADGMPSGVPPSDDAHGGSTPMDTASAAVARRALGSVEDLRRAIVLREIIGPPAALRPSPDESLLSGQMGS